MPRFPRRFATQTLSFCSQLSVGATQRTRRRRNVPQPTPGMEDWVAPRPDASTKREIVLAKVLLDMSYLIPRRVDRAYARFDLWSGRREARAANCILEWGKGERKNNDTGSHCRDAKRSFTPAVWAFADGASAGLRFPCYHHEIPPAYGSRSRT